MTFGYRVIGPALPVLASLEWMFLIRGESFIHLREDIPLGLWGVDDISDSMSGWTPNATSPNLRTSHGLVTTLRAMQTSASCCNLPDAPICMKSKGDRG